MCLFMPLVRIIRSINWNCGSVYGVCVPKRCGKTELIKSVESDRYILLDIEAVLQISLDEEHIQKLNKLKMNLELESYNAYYYPLAKQYLDNLRKDFKNKNIIVFASDPKLLRYCRVVKVVYCSPSNKLFNKLLSENPTEDMKQLLIRSRDVMIRLSGDKLKGYSTFEQLQQLVVEKFKLKAKI